MMKRHIIFISCLFACFSLHSQEIILDERASLNQVYLDSYESEGLLPMNELDMEFGYVLYQADVTVEGEENVLELENVRDYAAVYIDGKLQGTVTDSEKKLTLNIAFGKYTLQLYAENIGRITYGPEILDNLKGLFGSITLDLQEIEGWTMIPLNIKNMSVADLIFNEQNQDDQSPRFYRGFFNIETPRDTYLDISGWGMGEVWINGKYMGSYWEKEKQQSIQVASENLVNGKNEIIVFDLKNNQQKKMKLVDNPIFK